MVGALGFEPRSAGVFRFSCAIPEPHTLGSRRVGAPVGHQTTFSKPLVVIPVQLEPAVLPGYTIPPLGILARNRPYLISAVTDGLDDGRAFSFEASSYATSSAGCLASSRLEIRASCDFPTCPPYISAPHTIRWTEIHSSSASTVTIDEPGNSKLDS